MNEDLKPCPFCGLEAHFFDCGVKGDFEDWLIECSNCHIAMIYHDDGCVSTKEEAAEVWNRRADNESAANAKSAVCGGLFKGGKEMSKSSNQLPIIIGHKYRKGVFCIRSNMGGYDMYIVTLRSDYQTGEKFDMSEIEQIHTVLHFCDRSAVEQTIGALEWILKRGIEDDRKRSD